jgi:4-hydroxy-tetrahydrodipicolinate synthase
VKHAVGGIDHDTVMLMADPAEGFAVLAGDDLYAAPLLALGAAAWQAGRAVEGRGLGRKLAPLAAALFAEPNPAVIKGVLHAQGKIPSPAVRLPLLPARAETVRTALRLADAAASTAAEVFAD